MRKLSILTALLLLAGFGQCAELFPGEITPVSIGHALPGDFEASGITWHSGRQAFFVVSDCGILCGMEQTGELLQYWDINKDLEAVTVAYPQSDFIYLGVEDPDSICEFNIVTGQITRTFDLTNWMDGPDNSGLEALTFVPRADDPEGGLFYAGLQETGQIFVFRLPIVSGGTGSSVTFLGIISPVNGSQKISDLSYVPSQQVLYAIYDGADLLRVMETDGTVLGVWELPGKDQEGIAVKGRQLYICEDYGKDGGDVLRYQPFALLPQPDLDGDGMVDMQDLAVLAAQWIAGQDAAFSDVDGDGWVGLGDIAILCESWLAGK